MTTVTVSKNGQVSIPARYRKEKGILPHQKLDVEITDEGILYKTPEIESRGAFFEDTPASGKFYSDEQHREAIEEGFTESYKRSLGEDS